MAVVLGVALGPHATIVEARDADTGELVSTGRVRHADVGSPPDDPTTWWRSLVVATGRAGIRNVAAMSVTGSHPGLVLTDGAEVVLRPVQAWDGASAEVARLRDVLGSERWARRTGSVPDAGTAITRLSWLRRNDTAAFRRIGAVLLPHDWLTFRLTGRAVTDRGSASCTGMWSPHTESWLPEIVDLLVGVGLGSGWLEHLPEVREPDAAADWLDAPVFEQLGLGSRPLVAPGTAEPMAIALALGLSRGKVGVSLGDGTTVIAPLGEPIVDGSGRVHSRADATGSHLAVVHTPGGASLVEAVADLLDLHVADLGQVALTAGPATDDVVVVPGVAGRSGAVVTGVGPGTGRDALARATFDGIAGAAIASLEAITEAGARWYDHEPIHLTGPAEALDAHAQALATLSGRTVVATAGSLAAAGACVQAAAVLAGAHPAEVADGWELADGWEHEPEDDPEREHRLAVLGEERDRQGRAWEDEG